MSRLLIHFLYVVLVMLPLTNPVAAADDELMGLEEDVMSEEQDVMSEEELLSDDELISEEDDLSDDELMADEELLASADEELLASAEDDLLGDDSGSEEDIGMGLGGSPSGSGDEVFPVAYEHIDDMKVFDPARYRERRGDFGYYKTGSPMKNSFRVNENNEESTDETIGILFFIVALPAQVYMNFYGWWQ